MRSEGQTNSKAPASGPSLNSTKEVTKKRPPTNLLNLRQNRPLRRRRPTLILNKEQSKAQCICTKKCCRTRVEHSGVTPNIITYESAVKCIHNPDDDYV